MGAHSPEWVPFVVSSGSQLIALHFLRHSTEWSRAFAQIFEIRLNGFVIRQKRQLWSIGLGLHISVRPNGWGLRPNVPPLAYLHYQTSIKWLPIFAISSGMTRNTCEHLETRALSSTLESKPRTRSELPRNLPKTPKMNSKHHGDKNKVKSCVKCVKNILKRETRHYNKEINVL